MCASQISRACIFDTLSLVLYHRESTRTRADPHSSYFQHLHCVLVRNLSSTDQEVSMQSSLIQRWECIAVAVTQTRQHSQSYISPIHARAPYHRPSKMSSDLALDSVAP